MKIIPLKIVKFVMPGERDAQGNPITRELSYHEFLLGAVQRPVNGLLIGEVAQSLRILQALEKTEPNGELVLEDSDHARLVELFDQIRFAVVHPVITAFGDAVHHPLPEKASSKAK